MKAKPAPEWRIAALLFAAWTFQAEAMHRWSFDFAEGRHGFVAGFADLPATYDPDYYELASEWTARPGELGGAPALYISGVNGSDDLWMFWKKRLTGFEPDTSYLMTVEIEFVSKYPPGQPGIGGSPGDSVFLKTGAASVEPGVVIDPDDWLRMNIDKGQQSTGGIDMGVRGTIAKEDDENEDHAYVVRHHHGQPQAVTATGDGSLWFIFGTDSGFEGETAIYYTRVTIWVTRKDELHLWMEPDLEVNGLRLIWNTGSLQTSTDLENWQPTVVPVRPPVFTADPDPRRFWRLVGE